MVSDFVIIIIQEWDEGQANSKIQYQRERERDNNICTNGTNIKLPYSYFDVQQVRLPMETFPDTLAKLKLGKTYPYTIFLFIYQASDSKSL